MCHASFRFATFVVLIWLSEEYRALEMSPPFVIQFAAGVVLRSVDVNAGAAVIEAAAAVRVVVGVANAALPAGAVPSNSCSAPVLLVSGSDAADPGAAKRRLAAQPTRSSLNLMCPSCGRWTRGC
jgi:hypothetical protein